MPLPSFLYVLYAKIVVKTYTGDYKQTYPCAYFTVELLNYLTGATNDFWPVQVYDLINYK